MNRKPISPSKYDRKSIEKNRRNQMKALSFKLCSLLPRQSSKEIGSMSDQLEEAARYINKLQERLEVMKQKRNFLKVQKSVSSNFSFRCESDAGRGPNQESSLEVHANGSTLDVVLVTGVQHRCMFKEIIRILTEEGTDVVSAGLSVLDGAVFHNVYSEIGGSGLENGGASICEKLRKFVAGEN
ncbi:transcription factor bHLH162-like protein [Salvia divinorum]|uniref:Transcription factor bHLH162-like protein n=1 Tax=Salvia divinorum TaxID=28513 RepID=A0ABD1IF94_SALDI